LTLKPRASPINSGQRAHGGEYRPGSVVSADVDHS
jgi:hypothetical protein